MTTQNIFSGIHQKCILSLSFIFFLFSIPCLNAQSPTGFNFQAVARDAAGNPIRNTDVTVTAGIISGSETGELVWEEAQSVTTNEFGLFNLIICGDEKLKTGGSALTPGEIGWSRGVHFIDLAIKAGIEEVALGVQQLLPVPYSLASTGVTQSLSSLSVQSDSTLPDGEALFIVKRNDGYPVFAVYEDRVWVYTDTAAKKGVKGGFAVGGYSKTAKGEAQDYMLVTPDSVRFYIDQADASGKGVKGGFAVGGYSKTAKGEAQDYMRVTTDNVSFNIDQGDTLSKGVKGGFAVGGYRKTAKGSAFNFLSLTPDNYFIGHEAGKSNTTGLHNSFIGYQSGMANTEGKSNIFIGYQSGISNTLGEYNTFVGFMAGFSNIGNKPDGGVPKLGRYNCYLGYQAGYSSLYGDNNTMVGHNAGRDNTASLNTFVGSRAGEQNTEGAYNTFMGVAAGVENLTGGHNIFIGHQAGHSNTDGEDNVSIGTVAGAGIKSGKNNVIIGSGTASGPVYGGEGTGSSNVIIGYEAGKNAHYGSYNIFIGNQAGSSDSGSNKLYIANSETSQPLIWGDFEQKNLVVNGSAVDNPEKMNFYVNGISGGTDSWSSVSDARLKTDIVPIPQALEKVLDLQGVLFSWKETEMQDLGRQMGFVAQQAESVIPEVVSYKGDRYSMQYAPITALLVEAIKEQQQIIDLKEVELDDLKARIERLEKLLLPEE